MRKDIRIKVEKELPKTTITEYSTLFEVTDATKVSELKKQIKDNISFTFELVKETLTFKSKDLKDDDTIVGEGSLTYKLIVK